MSQVNNNKQCIRFILKTNPFKFKIILLLSDIEIKLNVLFLTIAECFLKTQILIKKLAEFIHKKIMEEGGGGWKLIGPLAINGDHPSCQNASDFQ